MRIYRVARSAANLPIAIICAYAETVKLAAYFAIAFTLLGTQGLKNYVHRHRDSGNTAPDIGFEDCEDESRYSDAPWIPCAFNGEDY